MDDNSVSSIIKKNVFTYFNGIFFVISILLVIVGSYRNLTFLPVIIANTVIGIIQQLRAKSILDKLTLLSQSKYHVLRDGKELEVSMDDLRKNDLIYLCSGQQIPGDGEITEGQVSVNESLLTGEADEIEKNAGSKLMSGSFVVSGECTARLYAVGEDSYIEKLTAKAKQMKEHPSEMIHAIDWIVKVAGIAIIPIGILLMYQGMVINHLTFQASVESMVGAIIGMIPEGLYLLVTIALVISAAKLARNQVLLHDMRSTETLARVDVLCVDKTGTITSNDMNVEEVLAPVGRTTEEVSKARRLLADYVATSKDNNITAKAMQAYFTGGHVVPTLAITGFSSKLKYSEIQTSNGTYRLGAPEFILQDDILDDNKAIIEEQSGNGRRVLTFAKRVEDTFEPLLFIALSNGIREGVQETFAYFASQEVRVMVISGDNPRTVSEIAASVGIPNADLYVDASTLKSDREIYEAVERYTVFGRVKPEQKKAIVRALKKRGQKVAMTGDGVNDILAMKEADCSIAMGAGSDAAMQAAQVVLLDSDFSHMKQIISEGRRDINNITRSATLFLYKNIFSMLLAIFAIVNAFAYPLQPTQVSLVSTFNIGVPAFLLALEANIQKQHGKFIEVTLMRAMPAALTSFLSIATMVVFGKMFHISDGDVGIASTYLLSMVGFMILIRLCSPMNIYRKVILFGCLGGFIFCAYFFSSLFAIDHISVPCLLLAVVFVFVQESLMRNFSKFFDWIEQKSHLRKDIV